MKTRTPGGGDSNRTPTGCKTLSVMATPAWSVLQSQLSCKAIVNLPLHLIKQYELKAYWEGQVQLQTFLTSTLDTGE